MEVKIGDLVVSNCGHDKDKLFIVAKVDGKFAYLCDGDLRRIDNPKKKKFKHINSMNFHFDEFECEFAGENKVLDAKYRKSIARYKNRIE